MRRRWRSGRRRRGAGPSTAPAPSGGPVVSRNSPVLDRVQLQRRPGGGFGRLAGDPAGGVVPGHDPSRLEGDQHPGEGEEDASLRRLAGPPPGWKDFRRRTGAGRALAPAPGPDPVAAPTARGHPAGPKSRARPHRGRGGVGEGPWPRSRLAAIRRRGSREPAVIATARHRRSPTRLDRPAPCGIRFRVSPEQVVNPVRSSSSKERRVRTRRSKSLSGGGRPTRRSHSGIGRPQLRDRPRPDTR